MDANNSGMPQSTPTNTNPVQDSPATNLPNPPIVPSVPTPPAPPIETPSAESTPTVIDNPLSAPTVSETTTSALPPQPQPVEPIVEPVIAPDSSVSPTPSAPPEPLPSPLPTAETPVITESPPPKPKRKLASFALTALVFLGLATATFAALSFLDKSTSQNQLASNQTKIKSLAQASAKPKASAQAKVPFNALAKPQIVKKGDYALSVNGEVLSWQEYEDLINYHYMANLQDTNTEDFKTKVKNELTEQLLIQGEAKKLNVSLTEEHKKEAEINFFGLGITGWLKQFPEVQRIIKAEAYKLGLMEQIVNWRSGGYIFITFSTKEAETIAKKNNQDPKNYYQSKIEALYKLAQNGESIENLIEQVKTDQEIMFANQGGLLSDTFTNFVLYSNKVMFLYEDPQWLKYITSLNTGELSPIFILKQPLSRENNTWTDYAFVFIKITEKQDNQYQYFTDWLDPSLKTVQVVSNL